MTIIVFDGATVASDGLITRGGKDLWHDAPKFQLVRGHVVASAGTATWGERFNAWLANPRRKYPIISREKDDDTLSDAMVITPCGASLHYWSDETSPETMGGKWAIGCGYQYARAALLLGADAQTACWTAMQLDPGCGGSLWAATLKDLRTKGNGAIKKVHNRPAFDLQAKARPASRAFDAARAFRKGHLR